MEEHDRRPNPAHGTVNVHDLWASVGAALTFWERLESSLGELFDVMVSGKARAESNAAAFAVYVSVSTAEARIQMLQASCVRALRNHKFERESTLAMIHSCQHFRARRNDIAHGMVVNLDEHGHFLVPNNVSGTKWGKDGSAKYQWGCDEIDYYTEIFRKLEDDCLRAVAVITALISAERSSSTPRN